MSKWLLFLIPFLFVTLAMSLWLGAENLYLRSQLKPKIERTVAKVQGKPTPTPATPKPDPVGEATQSAVLAYIRQTFPGDELAKALAAIRKESKFNCAYVGPNGETGLFGITARNQWRFEGEDMTDCYKNIDVGKQLVQELGWGAFK
jgi:hypothetical protein